VNRIESPAARREELGRLRKFLDEKLAERTIVDALVDPMIEFLNGACLPLSSSRTTELLARVKRQLSFREQRLASRVPAPPVSDVERGVVEDVATALRACDEVKDALMKASVLRTMEATNEERGVYDLYMLVGDVAAVVEEHYNATRDGLEVIERLRGHDEHVETWLMAQQAKRLAAEANRADDDEE